MWKEIGIAVAMVVATVATAEAQVVAPAPDAGDAAKARRVAEATQKFGGIEFGVGVSLTADLGKRDRIGEATVVGGVVRVEDANNANARIMLESHYFFKPRSGFLGVGSGMWGAGPFVALQPGTDEIIEAIGLGLMVGFRRSAESTESFNLGVGLVVDPNVRVLGDGIREGQPIPAGETGVRYKETSQKGVLVIASFSF